VIARQQLRLQEALISALTVTALGVSCRQPAPPGQDTPRGLLGVSAKRVASAPSAPAVSAASAATTTKAEPACVTPESVGVSALGSLSGDSGAEKAAVLAAQRELSRLLEVPADYFGNVQTAGDLVLLELWHRSAFPPHGCVAPGSSGGKRRTLSYDPRKQRIVTSKVWEPDAEAEPGAAPSRSR
jgi:hypothetical protein